MKRFAIIPLLLLGLLSGGFRGLGNTTACSFIVPNAGAVTANSLAAGCLSNPADTVVSLTNWSTAANYLYATNQNQYVFKSLSTYRDVEVSHWAPIGYTYLRLDSSGTAVYFFHNVSQSTGYLEIGIVTGLNESAYPSGTYYPLFKNSDLVGTIGTAGVTCHCGYTTTATQGQYFTFGVSGFDIYAKYNGTEFVRFKEYRQMNYGSVALKTLAGFGFRNADGNAGHITITPTYPPALYSRYSVGELDMRDFGMRSIQTTGTVSASSNSLAIAAKQNFKLGDWVIVEIGAEAGAGARGTIGVGGQWPALTKTNVAALNADTTEALNTFGWAQDTGLVYQWNGSAWTSSFAASTYYNAEAVPLSLHGRISAISADGLTLTLIGPSGSAANAAVTATNANVYLDSQPFINYLIGNQLSAPGFYANLTPITPTGATVILPAGTYAGSGLITLDAQSGWTITGQGQSSTTLFAPKGVYSLGIVVRNLFSGLTISNLTLTGNLGLEKYGLTFPGWTYIPGGLTNGTIGAGLPQGLMPSNPDLDDSTVITQTNVPSDAYPQGIHIIADNTTVHDVTVNDVFQKAIGVNYGNNVWGYRVSNIQSSAVQHYTQPQFIWANTTGGGCVDCSVNSPTFTGGFESFQAVNQQYIRPVGVNATIAHNDSQGWLVQDATITINATSIPPYWSPNNPMVNINTNIGSDNVAAGGTLNNVNMTVQNYIDASNDVPVGIIVNFLNPNITITGGSFTAPNYASPSALVGPQGIRSTGPSTFVSGFKSCGTLSAGSNTPSHANIGVSNGSITNSTADVLVLTTGTQSGNTIPCP